MTIPLITPSPGRIPLALAWLVLAVAELARAHPAAAQVLRHGDLAEAWQIVECGWSDSGGTDSVPELNVHASAGALAHGRASAPDWEVPWQAGAHAEVDRGCYRSLRLRAEVFGAGVDAPGVRGELTVPLGTAIPTAPEPGHAEGPRFLRLFLVFGGDVASAGTFSGLGAERQRAWAGLGAASPQLSTGWGGVERLLARVVVTVQAEAYSEDRVRPRVAFNFPLALQRWNMVGVLMSTDRVYGYEADADLERRSVTLLFSPRSGAADNLAIAIQGADSKLGTTPRRGQVGVHLVLIQNIF